MQGYFVAFFIIKYFIDYFLNTQYYFIDHIATSFATVDSLKY